LARAASARLLNGVLRWLAAPESTKNIYSHHRFAQKPTVPAKDHRDRARPRFVARARAVARRRGRNRKRRRASCAAGPIPV
jgi:hypothetical protein